MDADFIAKTIELWEARTGRRLPREDAREITENMVGFFNALLEWDRKELDSSAHTPAGARLRSRGKVHGREE